MSGRPGTSISTASAPSTAAFARSAADGGGSGGGSLGTGRVRGRWCAGVSNADLWLTRTCDNRFTDIALGPHGANHGATRLPAFGHLPKVAAYCAQVAATN